MGKALFLTFLVAHNICYFFDYIRHKNRKERDAWLADYRRGWPDSRTTNGIQAQQRGWLYALLVAGLEASQHDPLPAA